MSYQNQSSTYVPADTDLKPIRVTKIGITRLTHVHCNLEVFRVSPKHEFAHLCLALFNKTFVVVMGDKDLAYGLVLNAGDHTQKQVINLC